MNGLFSIRFLALLRNDISIYFPNAESGFIAHGDVKKSIRDCPSTQTYDSMTVFATPRNKCLQINDLYKQIKI
jgi:hypothetical protein